MLNLIFNFRLKKLEAGGYDADDFYKWQLEKKQQDLEAKLAAIEKRRLIGKLSHEEAILARTHLIAEKHERVQIMKEEASYFFFFRNSLSSFTVICSGKIGYI